MYAEGWISPVPAEVVLRGDMCGPSIFFFLVLISETSPVSCPVLPITCGWHRNNYVQDCQLYVF